MNGSILTKSNFAGAPIINAKLKDAKLEMTSFEESDLTNCDLTSANLFGSNLNNANLTKARLVDTDLRSASLVNAGLIGANLINANLLDTNLFLADVNDAELMGAFNIKHALGLPDDLLLGPRNNELNSNIEDKNIEIRSLRKKLEFEEQKQDGQLDRISN